MKLNYYINPKDVDDFQRTPSKNKDALESMLKALEEKKLLSNRQKIDLEMNYMNLMRLHAQIMNSPNNKIYVIKIMERRRLVTKWKDEMTNDEHELQDIEDEDKREDKYIVPESIFVCKIKYSFEISRVYLSLNLYQHWLMNIELKINRVSKIS